MRSPEGFVPQAQQFQSQIGESPVAKVTGIDNIANQARGENDNPSNWLIRVFKNLREVSGKKVGALALTAASLLSACADGGSTETTPPPTSPTTITTEVPTTTTEAPTTTTTITVPETTTTTEPCPIIESSRKNFYGNIPADLGNIHTYVESNNSFSYSLLNGRVLGWGNIEVENFGNTGETHSVTYVELGFGNSGEGENCRIVSAKIGVGSKEIPNSASLRKYNNNIRDFKSSQFEGVTGEINQELIDYINDMQQRGLEIGISLVTKTPNGIIFPWCNNISINDQNYGTCVYNTEENKSIDRNNNLINALQEFKDTDKFPFDSIDPNALYYGFEFYKLDHSNL